MQQAAFAQTCPAPNVPPADLVNVITNPGFETGNVLPGNTGSHTPMSGSYSSPGTYLVGASSNAFNPGMIQNILPHTGTRMLMIDGVLAANATAWEQTVTVQPNKMYYFSAWLTALSAVEKSQMVFQVQPVAPVAGPATNISTYFVPPNGPTWEQEFGSWFSGSTTTVTIRLVNTNPLAVGGAGNDYAIDDIMFRPTCVGTTAGPKPNLGPDALGICNSGGKVDLNAQIPAQSNISFTWFRDGGMVANTTTPNILEAQNNAGVYVVCVDSAGCVKSDTITLTTALVIDLGADVNLCNPSSKLLDTRITSTNGFTITWYRDNIVIPNATGPTYLATGAGTYRVEATNGSTCTDSDEITITSQVDETVSAYYCPTSTTTSTVSVIDAGGTYTWYDSQTGGTVLGTGLTYTATGLTTPETVYTYYVGNSKPATSGAGLPNASSPYLAGYGPNNVHGQNMMIFSANIDATITSITVILDMNANYAGNVTITLEDRTTPGTVTSTYPVSNNPGAAGAYNYPIPLNLSIIAGHTYWISIVGVNGSSFAHRYTGGNISSYFPANYTAVTLLSGQANTVYPGLFDWKFEHPSSCARVPARITDSCVVVIVPPDPPDTTVVNPPTNPPVDPQALMIPNLVTPNGDAKNDAFAITGLPAKSKLLICNRWGQAIYESSDYDNGWVDSSDGIYFYVLTVPDGKSYKGWVQVIR